MTAIHCTKCGQPLPGQHMLDADGLLNLLRHGVPHREVYRGQDGAWYVTYGGERATAAAVASLVRQGAISSVYGNCPDSAYHVGRTIDMEATMAERQKRGKKAPLVYVGDSTVDA